MMPQPIRQALFFEVHRSIDDAARAFVANLVSLNEPALSYPPNGSLTEAERAAIRELALSPEARTALEKIAADACSHPLFHLFAVMDGVADPETHTGEWPGLTLAPGQEDGADEMLHDEFLESFWDYSNRR